VCNDKIYIQNEVGKNRYRYGGWGNSSGTKQILIESDRVADPHSFDPDPDPTF
jgi:hypothetical protein